MMHVEAMLALAAEGPSAAEWKALENGLLCSDTAVISFVHVPLEAAVRNKMVT